MEHLKAILFLPTFLTACGSSTGKQKLHELSGKVIAVKDGDTIEILYDGKPLNDSVCPY